MKTILTMVMLASALASPARAATLNISDGVLVGAYNVDLAGVMFNVEFIDGSCVSIFDGCDSLEDVRFNTSSAFQDQASHRATSFALISQVLIDSELGAFDSVPGLVNGCVGGTSCSIFSPFFTDGVEVLTFAAFNSSGFDTASSSSTAMPIAIDTSSSNSSVYAKWTLANSAAVPVPGGMILLNSAIIGLMLARRKLIQ